ncbi:MAG: methyltransferase domain-containing protein [Betaproteobacteria bacterium]
MEAFQHSHEWDSVAQKYERAFVKVSRKFAAHALRLVDVQPGMRVLDVAAGTGALTVAAARAGAQVDAIDFSPVMVGRLRENVAAAGLDAVTAHEMDGQALIFPDDTFDAAFSVFGLMFFPDRSKGIREMHRVLLAGGRVGIVVWNHPDRVGSLRLLSHAIRQVAGDVLGPPGPALWQELQDSQRFRRELEETGFRNAHIHTVEQTWEASSPEHLWDDMVGMTPALEPLYRKLGPERLGWVAEAFVAAARAENGGDGPIAMRCEAHIGLATK